MKYKNILNTAILGTMLVIGVTSCKDEITIGESMVPDASTGVPAIYVAGEDGSNGTSAIEIHRTGSVSFKVMTASAQAASTNVKLSYDAAALDDYNDKNGTAYECLPESMASFNNNVTINAGSKESSPVTLSIESDGSLDPDKVYGIPLLISSNNASTVKVFLVKDLSNLNNCDKGEGIKVFSLTDVSKTNLMNNTRFTLQNSGKYLVDAVVLFTGNINYDEDAASVYFSANPDLQYVLDHKDEFISPLKNRGMKVLMGIQCNFDRACIAGLDDESAKKFAKDLNVLCDVYDLDGIYYHDDYCNHDENLPGFTTRGPEALSRLAFELWKLQPERLNVIYGTNSGQSGVEIDEIEPGEFISYVFPTYTTVLKDWSSDFPGLTKSQMGAATIQCSFQRYLERGGYDSMKSGEFGAILLYGMDPFLSTAEDQENAFNEISQVFYDEEISVNPTTYEKNW